MKKSITKIARELDDARESVEKAQAFEKAGKSDKALKP
jgi:hypothetical protein